MTSKNRLYVSIAAIIIYWAFAATTANRESMPPANDMAGIVRSILVAKFSVLAVIFILLRVEQEQLSDIGFNSTNVGKRILSGAGFGTIIWLIPYTDQSDA